MEITADDDIGFLEDDIKTIKGHTRKTEGKKIKVRSSVQVAKDDKKRVYRIQKTNIKRLKRQIKLAKIMKKQAKNRYKVIKLEEKK